MCLCRLHNFCIDNKEGQPLANTDDAVVIAVKGAANPSDLMDGSDHFMDSPRNARRRLRRIYDRSMRVDMNPREALLEIVARKDRRRPKPVSNRHRG